MVTEPGFREVVQTAWDRVKSFDPGDGVLTKLRAMHVDLHAWDSSYLNKSKKRLRQAQRDFEKAISGRMNDENETIAKEKAALIELILEQEETHWAQRSRANGLMQGDRNTTLFHQFATARRKKNRICKLKDDQNNWLEGTDALKPHILQYFSNLFTSEVQAIDPELLEKIIPKVDQAMNDSLLAPFSHIDIKKAVFSIGDLKAPGPDGLHAIFYKRFWELFGDDISQEILQALNTGIIPEGWNDTTIVLIPKVDTPELVT
jgi:hypothetical protein